MELSEFNAAKIGVLKRQGHAPKCAQVQAYDVKIHLFSQGVEKQDFEGYCGGRSVTRTIKVKLIRPVAHPRMQIYPRRPRSDCKGNHMNRIVNIMKGEFSIRPRTQSSSAT